MLLLNGTSRNGLATSVKRELVARGFTQVEAATAPAALPGPSQVVYGPGGLPAATEVMRHILDAVPVSDPTAAAGSIKVTLGSDYRRLATPAEVAARSLGGPPPVVPTTKASPCV